MSDINLEVEEALDEIRRAGMVGKLEAGYGRTKSELEADGNEFSTLGFDGREVMLGWTLSNVKWLLGNRGLLDAVAGDGAEIAGRYRHVVFSGMGGSGLSVQAVKDTFGEKGPKLYSLRTTDRAVIKDIVDGISSAEGGLKEGLERTLVIPVSKSGRTAETLSHMEFFERLFRGQGIDPAKHMWVITDKGSPIDRGVFPQREIQLNGRGDIGGRYTSPTTRIFLLPLAVSDPRSAKARMVDILGQAKEMNDFPDVRQDVFIRLGAFLHIMAARHGKDKLTMMVPDELKSLPMWSEQLFEESLGKGGKGVTVFYGENLDPAALRPPGECDRVFLRINIGGKKTDDPFWRRLESAGYPTFEIEVRDVNSVGGVMLGLQRAVATIGFRWGICFVDQPGVEGYKIETRRLMEEAERSGAGKVQVPGGWAADSAEYGCLRLYYGPLLSVGAVSSGELKARVGRLGSSMGDAAAVYAAAIKIMGEKPGFEAAELGSYGRMTPRLRAALETARDGIFTHGLRKPSKLSEGPDKNHSFQQNIQDGRNMFFSTYLTYADVPEIPEAAYDVNLLMAPTIGTVKSMIRAGRKSVLIVAENSADGAAGDVGRFFGEVRKHLGSGS